MVHYVSKRGVIQPVVTFVNKHESRRLSQLRIITLCSHGQFIPREIYLSEICDVRPDATPDGSYFSATSSSNRSNPPLYPKDISSTLEISNSSHRRLPCNIFEIVGSNGKLKSDRLRKIDRRDNDNNKDWVCIYLNRCKSYS